MRTPPCQPLMMTRNITARGFLLVKNGQGYFISTFFIFRSRRDFCLKSDIVWIKSILLLYSAISGTIWPLENRSREERHTMLMLRAFLEIQVSNGWVWKTLEHY